jgi:hypothetical protein
MGRREQPNPRCQFQLARARCAHPALRRELAIIANRHVHARFRGATPVSCTLSGTQRNGADTATSVMATRHPPGMSLSCIVISPRPLA